MPPVSTLPEHPPTLGSDYGFWPGGKLEAHCPTLMLRLGAIAGGSNEGGELGMTDFGAVDPEAIDAGLDLRPLLGVAAKAAELEAATLDPLHAGVRIAAEAGRQSRVGLAVGAIAQHGRRARRTLRWPSKCRDRHGRERDESKQPEESATTHSCKSGKATPTRST